MLTLPFSWVTITWPGTSHPNWYIHPWKFNKIETKKSMVCRCCSVSKQALFQVQMLGKPGGYVLSRFPSPCSPHESSLLLIASDHSRKPLSQHLNNEQKWVLVLVRFAACFFRPRKPLKYQRIARSPKYIYIPWIERWLKSHGNQKKRLSQVDKYPWQTFLSAQLSGYNTAYQHALSLNLNGTPTLWLALVPGHRSWISLYCILSLPISM